MFTTPASSNAITENIVKKSRFIGRVCQIRSVEEAETDLASIHHTEKSATHNCYAYSVGLGVPVERFSDDGEPNGTAGRPILEVIRRRNVANVLIVVTRYFGGTLLGANGLVRAYTETAACALDETPLLTCREMNQLDISCEYGQFGKLAYEFNRLEFSLLNQSFLTNVSFSVLAPIEDANALCQWIADWSMGQAHVVVQPAKYVGIGPDGSFRFDVV